MNRIYSELNQEALKAIEGLPPLRILDLGVGESMLKNYETALGSGIGVVGIDICKESLAKGQAQVAASRQRIEQTVGLNLDINRLPQTEELKRMRHMFDAVNYNFPSEGIDDDALCAVVNETLKPGGYFLIMLFAHSVDDAVIVASTCGGTGEEVEALTGRFWERQYLAREVEEEELKKHTIGDFDREGAVAYCIELTRKVEQPQGIFVGHVPVPSKEKAGGGQWWDFRKWLRR